MNDKLRKQMDFIVTADKMKSIFRKSRVFDGSRYENDAEHSWHIALMAMVLAEYSNEKIDLLKVLKMLLIHDLVEIHCGDVLVYAGDRENKENMEKEGAEKVFSLLPDGQYREFKELWVEFEKRETAESKFAAALDRLEPVMQNCYQNGRTWVENGVQYHQIIEVNSRIGQGSEALWKYAGNLIDIVKSRGVI